MSYVFYKDSKFWLAILDVVVSVALYFVGKYSSTAFFDDIKFVIGIMQPIFVTIIVGLFQSQNTTLAGGESISAFRVK